MCEQGCLQFVVTGNSVQSTQCSTMHLILAAFTHAACHKCFLSVSQQGNVAFVHMMRPNSCDMAFVHVLHYT